MLVYSPEHSWPDYLDEDGKLKSEASEGLFEAPLNLRLLLSTLQVARDGGGGFGGGY